MHVNELGDEVLGVGVEVVDEPLCGDAFGEGILAGGFDELCVVVDSNACYAATGVGDVAEKADYWGDGVSIYFSLEAQKWGCFTIPGNKVEEGRKEYPG